MNDDEKDAGEDLGDEAGISAADAADAADEVDEDEGPGWGWFRRATRNLAILAVIFLLGFLMQFREVRSLRTTERDQTAEITRLQSELEVERLGSTLAGAALYASHGDHGLAREEAIRFFDGIGFLRMQVDEEDAAVLLELAQRRDDIVGALGSGESFGIYQLAGTFARFQMAMTGREYTFTVPTGLPPEYQNR